MPLRIFASGSCRVLTSLFNSHDKIETLHSIVKLFECTPYFGRLHDTKQHIQFIEWIFNRIDIPENILNEFLTSYSITRLNCKIDTNSINDKKIQIASLFNTCDFYIFEICSLKLYKVDNYSVHWELTKQYRGTNKSDEHCKQYLQTEEDLYSDLDVLRRLVPLGKPILFQCHFRPNVIYNDSSKTIEKREIIYRVLTRFCENNKDVYLYDPSQLLQRDPSLFDGFDHFTKEGYLANFECIFKKISTLNTYSIVNPEG